MTTKELITELELNKEFLDDHTQKFVESVAEQFYKTGSVSEKQKEWLEIYYKKLKREQNVDESWLMNDFD